MPSCSWYIPSWHPVELYNEIPIKQLLVFPPLARQCSLYCNSSKNYNNAHCILQLATQITNVSTCAGHLQVELILKRRDVSDVSAEFFIVWELLDIIHRVQQQWLPRSFPLTDFNQTKDVGSQTLLFRSYCQNVKLYVILRRYADLTERRAGIQRHLLLYRWTISAFRSWCMNYLAKCRWNVSWLG